MRSLPWWFWFAVAVVKFWFVTIPLAIALALAARYGAPWLGAMRWVLIAGVILLALPYPAAALVVIYQSFDATRYWGSRWTLAAMAVSRGLVQGMVRPLLSAECL